MKELTAEDRAQIKAEQDKRAEEASARIHAETATYRAKITEGCPMCGSVDLRVGNEISGASWPDRPIECMGCHLKIRDDWDEPKRWNQRPGATRARMIEAALKELVACKDLKETYEARRDDDEAKRALAEYNVRQPVAWVVARTLLATKP